MPWKEVAQPEWKPNPRFGFLGKFCSNCFSIISEQGPDPGLSLDPATACADLSSAQTQSRQTAMYAILELWQGLPLKKPPSRGGGVNTFSKSTVDRRGGGAGERRREDEGLVHGLYCT